MHAAHCTRDRCVHGIILRCVIDGIFLKPPLAYRTIVALSSGFPPLHLAFEKIGSEIEGVILCLDHVIYLVPGIRLAGVRPDSPSRSDTFLLLHVTARLRRGGRVGSYVVR